MRNAGSGSRGAGRRRILAATGAMLLVDSAPWAQTQLTRKIIDFETSSVGSAPVGFTFALTGGGRPPDWTIVEDASAPAGTKVLSERSADRTDYRFPLAILEALQARDVALAVDFRPVAGTVDQAAGLVWRLRDARNYYVARANALEDNVSLYRVVDGRRIQFAERAVPVPRNQWQRLAVTMAHEMITVSLNGQVQIQATDRTFAAAGRVGIWTKADSVTYFDRLEVDVP